LRFQFFDRLFESGQLLSFFVHTVQGPFWQNHSLTVFQAGYLALGFFHFFLQAGRARPDLPDQPAVGKLRCRRYRWRKWMAFAAALSLLQRADIQVGKGADDLCL